MLTAAIFHQSLIRGITEIFKHRQNPEFDDPAKNEPGSKEAEGSHRNSGEVYDPDNSLVPDPNISGVTTIAEPETSVADISKYPAQNPPSDPSVLFANKTAPDRIETLKLADYLAAMDIRSSRYTALKNAMVLWQTPIELKPYLNSLDDDHAFFRLTVKSSGIFIHRIETNLDLLKRLDLPAILEFYPVNSEEPGYLTLSQTDGDKISFGLPRENKVIETTEDEINLYWSGVAYLPWKNYLSISGTSPAGTNSDSIITLKLLLKELGYDKVELNGDYDLLTRRVIEEIQTRYGIIADGFVGPLTKIILYKSKGSFDMPRLSRES